MPGWIAAMEQLGNGFYNSLMNNRHVDIILEEVQLRFLRLAKNEFLWCDLDLGRNYTISSTIEVDKGNPLKIILLLCFKALILIVRYNKASNLHVSN